MKKLTIEIEILNKFSINVKDAPNLRRILAPPNNVGVYTLKKGEDVLYVGMSTILPSRIKRNYFEAKGFRSNCINMLLRIN